MSDDESPSVGGYTDLTFCVFPSLEPTPESEAALLRESSGVYVPWELTAAPWQRLAKWIHQKYLVGMLFRGEPAVLVLQTNHAPEHPNRAALRSKTLLGWVATELNVAGEVRLVLRARVEGVGFTMEQQVSAAQEAHAREAVQAILTAIGEGEESTYEAVIACLEALELEPPSWLPYLEELRDGAADEETDEEGEEGEEGSASALLKFIEGAKAAGDASDTVADPEAEGEEEVQGSGTVADPEAEGEEEEEVQGEDEAASVAADVAAAAAAREQLDERAVIAARLMEEGRGMGLASRDELQGLLERCAESHGASQGVDGCFDQTREARWEDWEEQLWAPRTPRVERDAEETPPPGLSPKELKKWQKRQERNGKPRKSRSRPQA
jgi:hypothetical protein|tara:strand:- start:282 stop:1430 length:1149 start_codon:yes stop_codon:yes gene_type:complete